MSRHVRISSAVGQPSLRSFEGLVVGAGVAPEEFFQRLRADLAMTPDPVRAVNNLHRFLSSGFTSSMLRDFQAHPVLQRVALEVFAQSQYLADILVRDPELFRWLTATEALNVSKSRSQYVLEALAAVQLFTRMEKRFDALKRFHRREMLRIGAREILKEADVVVITQELSALAEAIVQTVLEIAQQDLAGRTGASFKNSLGVIGLGKLGGNELNFSSDIDLLFVYDEDGEFLAPQERIRTFHEYYNRLAEFIVRRLTEFTGEGHLYRVDMRLRPEGSAGPLAVSRGSYMLYYETRGELWERQMLLKARPIAGNVGVAQQLLESLQPYIFPKTFLISPLEEIARMKQRIEAGSDTAANIKLGEGGIRDIEFITQALQLLGGGRERVVKTQNTLEALEQLREKKRLSTNDQLALSKAYRFFRTVEHRLQLLHGMQTHSIPGSRTETDLLAKRLGYKNTLRFTREIELHRKRVRVIFSSVFGVKDHRNVSTKAVSSPADWFRKGLALRGLRLQDGAAAVRNLKELFENLSALSDEESWERVIRSLRKHGAPDWGLQNFTLLSESQAIRRTLTQSLANSDLLDLLLLICSRSRRYSELLAREPLLFESLVGQPEEIFGAGWSWGLMKENDLRRYRAYNEFKIVVQFLLGQISIERATLKFSDLAEHILLQVLRNESAAGTALVALGKLGGKEMTVGSDLDLILLYDEEMVESSNAERTAKLLVGEIGSKSVYELDFRLRPEGKNAPLASGFRYYCDYLRGRASLWERQSLTKARVVWGEEAFTKRIDRALVEAVTGSHLPTKWIGQIRSMRTRIERERPAKSAPSPDLKVAAGGLVDIEFALQVLGLRFGADFRPTGVRNSFEAIGAAAEAKLVKKSDSKKVKQNLRFLRALETLVRLNTESVAFVLPEDPQLLQALSAGMGEKSPEGMQRTIKSLQSQNRVFLRNAFKIARS